MRSGLQLRVLSLYRSFLRTATLKPAASRPRFQAAIRHSFRTAMKQSDGVGQRDIATVEYLVRRGEAQLEMLRSPDVTDVDLKIYNVNSK